MGLVFFFCIFVCFLVGDFIFKMPPKCSVEVLSGASKCLMERMHVLYKLFSGVSKMLLAVSYNVNKTNILGKGSLNRNTHKQGYVLIS